MSTPRRILATLTGVLALALPAAGGPLVEGREAGRAISLEVVVAAPPAAVYDLWLTPEGIRRFFAPAARIEPRVGGRYEILFEPQQDPQGERLGTKGARILALEPDRFLAFEWKGRPEMREMNARPLPTWVELRFERAAGNGGTRLGFAHYGFGRGGSWEGAYAFFDQAWRSVLASLKQACAEGDPRSEEAPRAAVTAENLTLPAPGAVRGGLE